MTEWHTHIHTQTRCSRVLMERVWTCIPVLVASPSLPNPHNSQFSPLIRTKNGTADSANMSDSCQLDHLSLMRLDFNLAATQLVSIQTMAVQRFFLPTLITVFIARRAWFFPNFLRINIYHCQLGLYINRHTCTLKMCQFSVLHCS